MLFHKHKLNRKLLLIGLGAIVACGTTSITFTKEKDNSVMQEVQSVWESREDNNIQLSLCEDMERSDEWNEPGGCQEAHVVRGMGRALEHKEQEPSGVGCGGCPFMVMTYVKGTIQGGPFTEPTPVAGTVSFGDLYDVEKIYHYPYEIYLYCTDEPSSCESINGSLSESGDLELQILDDINSEYLTVSLTMQGPSACQAID